MAYDTWDWDDDTGVGTILSNFKPSRYDPILKQGETEAGYMPTSPMDVRGRWIFRFEFGYLSATGYIYLLNFYHSHRGGSPFYFAWPVGFAGLPEGAELANPGGASPWDSEVAVGAGEGPTCLVQWLQDEFPVSRWIGPDNEWQTAGTIELRQA